MITINYRCAQQELYTICNLGWQSCAQHLAEFSSFKAKYTMPFITARQAEINDAMLLPDNQARGEIAESLRVQLAALTIQCVNTWQILKRYIIDAFPPDLIKGKNEAAGQEYYAQAANNDWDAVQGLMTNGFTFINTYSADLVNGLNMPNTFQAEFSMLRDSFNTLHQSFLDAEENARTSTQEKLLANNSIHSALMSMFLDGQEIYRYNEAIQKQFTFEQVWSLVSGPGVAGIKGVVTNPDVAHTPIPNAIITILETGDTALTDADGKYQISPVVSGTYQVKAEAINHQTLTVTNQQIQVGTVSTLNFVLPII